MATQHPLRHRRAVFAAAIAAAVATFTSAAHAADAPIVLKVAHFWPSTALAQQQVLEPWCKTIAEQSQQRLQCQIYPAMQLGGTPPQLMQQAIDGVADIVFTLPGYTAGRFPAVEVMELPFLSKNAEGGSRVAWEIYERFGKKDFAGLKPLAFNIHDRGQIHNNRRPIKKMSDLRGLKLRAPTRVTNQLVAALGATPVALPMPGVADGLSKGVIDGYVLPWEVVPTIKLHELTKFHSEINAPQPVLYSALFTIVMNQGRYDALPAELKKVIDANSGAEFSARIGRAWDASVTSAREQAVQRGNQFNTIDASAFADFHKAGERVTANWVKEVTGKGYDGAAILKTARELIEKHSAP